MGQAMRLDPRPSLTPALDAILATIVDRTPCLEGLEASSILVVGLGAHGTAAASIRSLDGAAHTVTIGRRRRRVELGLRPPFFLDGDAPRRLATLVHELLHLEPKRPGALREENRHARRSQASLDREAARIARQLLDEIPPVTLLCLAHDGEVLLRHWRHRPIAQTHARRFGERDAYEAPIPMHTAKGARGGWW